MPHLTVQQTFDLALQHHQAGRLQDAEPLYRHVLADQPAHADALHLLGVLAYQTGRHDAAIALIRQAIAANPNLVEPHNNLGIVLAEKGQNAEAILAFRQALALNPAYAEARYNLGKALRSAGQLEEAVAVYREAAVLNPASAEAHASLAKLLREAGHVNEAIIAYRQALALQPASAGTHSNLGNALRNAGRMPEAIAAYRQALALKPTFPEAHYNLAHALSSAGQTDEAIAAYRQAVALKPNFPEAHYNLGNALRDQALLADATAAYRQAIAVKPNYPEAHNNLGNALRDSGQADDAVAAYHQAIALRPNYSEAHNNLGNALRDQGRLTEALAVYRRAIVLNPRLPEAHNNVANALRDSGQIEEAITVYRRALELKPGYAEAHSNLGNALKDMGRLDEAIAAYRQAVALKPQYAEAHSNLVCTLHFHPDYDARAIHREHRAWNQQHAAPLQHAIEPHTNDRAPDRPLRIGYVSPDFRDHVVGRNLLPLFRHHDRRQFLITCYAHVPRPDAITTEFQHAADNWRNIVGRSDDQVARQIRADRIDILVDLTLHMARHRLLVFARKPAPVQVTFAGYPGTTGLSAIDYRLSDPHLDPPGMDESVYSEQTLRLPETFWCYDPLECRDVPVSTLPALANGYLTFGCLNNFCKVNAEVLRLWAGVLRALPSSRLLLLAPEGACRTRTLALLEQQGIAPARIEFSFLLPRRQYLALYHRIDLGLDTFPYNGHTTSLDSLWMGVPVIARVGPTVVGRAGLSQLMNLHLPDLIAPTAEQYVPTALAHDLPRLAGLRATLRQRMEQSPLMDAPRFARHIEAAYRTMWQTWCATPAPLPETPLPARAS